MADTFVCSHCGAVFASKNKLFAHLRSSACSKAAAADGLKVEVAQEKVALILGVAGGAGDWKPLLWRAIDEARSIGKLSGRESYARQIGAPGAAFATDARDVAALRHEASMPRCGEVLSLQTEVLAPDDSCEEWCARANRELPQTVRVLGRTEALPSGFHADLSCLRRCYHCVLPTWLLQPGAANPSALAPAKTAVPSQARGQHVRRGQGDPRWGGEAEREACLARFLRLKELMHGLQGERHFHNFATSAKITPSEAVARRHVFKFRAGDEPEIGLRGMSLAVDALLAGQLRAMVGLVVAIQRGLLPESYLEAALGDEALLEVPAIPEDLACFSGCVYSKQFHYRLQPLLDNAASTAWRGKIDEELATRARGAALEEWLAEVAATAPRLVSALEARKGALRPLGGNAPDLYLPVLRLLREAEASGKWPGISKGREKVILESTLAENGGGGGSFSVGSMPLGLEEPAANQLFPELVQCAFELERALMPGRAGSSTIAINKRAQFLPHVDSGAGAGQGISLIVGVGDYSGGELVVEGEQHDIRYSALEFNGWTQRHWTLPFEGERFSLVWFTPCGCEGRPGLSRCWQKQSAMQPTEPSPPSAALPQLGFGTHQLRGEACEAAVYRALKCGYRLIDTASIYKNEEAVGRAVRRWEREHPQEAGSVQVLSKCSNHEMGYENARAACLASLERLGRSCLDVYLLHWPAVAKKPHGSSVHRAARRESWRALEELKEEGKVKTIGVSNFLVRHLEQLMEDGAKIVPMVNQIEVHPFYQPLEVIEYCEQQGIAVQAYSPLGGGPGSNNAKANGGKADGTSLLFSNPSVCAIAEELGVSPAQVALRWGLQQGFAVIPRSSKPERILENSRVFDFCLSPEQMSALSALRSEGCAQKWCWDPALIQ